MTLTVTVCLCYIYIFPEPCLATGGKKGQGKSFYSLREEHLPVRDHTTCVANHMLYCHNLNVLTYTLRELWNLITTLRSSQVLGVYATDELFILT